MLVGFPQQVPLFQAAMSDEGRPPAEDGPILHSIHEQLDHKVCQSSSACVNKNTEAAADWPVSQQIKDWGLLKLSIALS